MHQLVAEWVDDTWKKIANDGLVMKRFRQYGYIEYPEFSVLHFELEKNNQATPISKRYHSRSKQIS